MLQRELQIAFRARLTWVQAVLSALLCGHSFVLALDLFSAASKSATAGTLLARELDPLLGVTRPALGGLYFAVSLLGPLCAARPVAIEKERGTWLSHLLFSGSPVRVCLAKWVAGLVAVALQLIAPVAMIALWAAIGGHLAAGETLTALLGHLAYLALIASLGTAAAAWSRTLAQAATTALLVIAASWAVDASEGFAALAWLGAAFDWSISAHLSGLERGVLSFGPLAWLLGAAAAGLAIAWVGMRFDFSPWRRRALAAAIALASGLALSLLHHSHRGVDLSEAHRQSLPPALAQALRAIDRPLEVTVWLDRDDARRTQLERDFVGRLFLARPDAVVRWPLDASGAASRDEDYGKIELRAGAASRVSRSSSPEELAAALIELGGGAPPASKEDDYPGYPLVVEGARRTVAAAIAYAVIPGGLWLLGWTVTRSKRRTR